MESKGEGKWGSDAVGIGGDDEEPAGKALVMRMCEYGFKVLNYEMDDFFEDNADTFDQDDSDLNSGRGETLAQYNIFKKYEEELDKKFDAFAKKEGFSSASECFDSVNQAVKDDLASHKKIMDQLMKRLKKAQNQWKANNSSTKSVENDFSASSKADSKDGEISEYKQIKGINDDDDDDNSDEKQIDTKKSQISTKQDNDEDNDQDEEEVPPLMMFFQPMTLESIVQTTLSIAEYQTFSFIMRMKCRQLKLLRQMDRKIELQKTRKIQRKKQLKSLSELSEIFKELIDRICELTPNRPDIIENTKNMFPTQSFITLLSQNIENEETKIQTKRLFSNIYNKLSQLSSIDEMQAMRKFSSDMMLAIDINDDTMKELSARFLQTCHDFIDRIELKIAEIMHEQRDCKKKEKQKESFIPYNNKERKEGKYDDDDDEK